MDETGSSPADFREFLKSGPDFDVLELNRIRQAARGKELDSADATDDRVDEP